MTSRTPIRLTPHRGPLATPSTSPESSPTLSTPPTDVSRYSIASSRPALDIVTLQNRISTLHPHTPQQSRSCLYHWKRRFTRQGVFDYASENLINSACDLAKSCAGIVTFCLFLWSLLESSSYASELPRQPKPSSMLRFPLPLPTRALRCHANPSLCEPRDQHAAVLQFLSEQIQHAQAMSSLSTNLGLPLRAFFEAHRTTVPKVIVRYNHTRLPHHVQEVDTLADLTNLLDSSFLDFTSGGFVGRTLTLALDELGDLVSEPIIPHGSSTHGEHQDMHLHAIYWRTTSNLLLEYSAAHPRARRLLHHLQALHQQLSLLASSYHTIGGIEGGLNIWWKDGGFSYPATSPGDKMQAFVTGLEIALDNALRLIAYLDWTTEQLAQTTFEDVLKIQQGAGFSSCMMLLKELFDQSKPPTPKKYCLCLEDYGVVSPWPERVGVIVPGSRTMRGGR